MKSKRLDDSSLLRRERIYAMISLKIDNVKDFMSALFFTEMFDRFLVMDVEIKMLFTTTISGRVNAGWNENEDEPQENQQEYVSWKQLREKVYYLIKGKKTPLEMNICYLHVMENKDVASLKIMFSSDGLRVMTGYSDADFTLDRSRKQQWDDNNKEFLKKHNIAFEEE
jgi:hypothetical protein